MTKLAIEAFWPVIIVLILYAAAAGVLVRYLEWKLD